MEQEKKKRWRPSMTLYRALVKENDDLKEKLRLQRLLEMHLENELVSADFHADDLAKALSECDSQLDVTSMLVKDCDGWREKYRNLLDKNNLLERSNAHMESAQKDMRAEIARLSNALEQSRAEVLVLKNRGFWARVFNK